MTPRYFHALLFILPPTFTAGCIVNNLSQSITDSGNGDDLGTTAEPTATESDTDASSSSGEESSSSGDPGPICGDGSVDPGEDCDDMGESPTCDSDCTPAACGDGLANTTSGEECDGLDLAGATCADVGYTGGVLSCDVGCSYDVAGCTLEVPAAPVDLALGFSAIKQFDFTWSPVPNADYYVLEQSDVFGDPFVAVSGDIVGESYSLTVALHLRHESLYRLLACNEGGCTPSLPLGVMGSLAEAIGYVKASNPDVSDAFGTNVALSDDGSTLVVATPFEDSSAIGVNGNGASNVASAAGAVYVFVNDGRGTWTQQAYLKASNTQASDGFGGAVALSGDGNTIAVGASGEDGSAVGIDGDQADDSATGAGAVYVFTRDGLGQWSQQAYVKASNTELGDAFGTSVALSSDGDTLAVGAIGEDSDATGVGGDPTANAISNAGAAYVLTRDDMDQWSHQAYFKASSLGASDQFGNDVALSGDGNTLAVAMAGDDSNAVGIDGDATNNSAIGSGAVYVFARDDMGTWSMNAYVKASNTGSSDQFGFDLALSTDGNTLAVGANNEDSTATDIDGDQVNNSSTNTGAVYVFAREAMGPWAQQAYVKASNTDFGDLFGSAVALDADGNTLVVGATEEDSNVIGINGNQLNNSTSGSGAAYVLLRDDTGVWSHQAYIKANNIGPSDAFGNGVALSGDGTTLAVGAVDESGNGTGTSGDPSNNDVTASGAVYLY